VGGCSFVIIRIILTEVGTRLRDVFQTGRGWEVHPHNMIYDHVSWHMYTSIAGFVDFVQSPVFWKLENKRFCLRWGGGEDTYIERGFLDVVFLEYPYPCNRPWRPVGLRDVKDPTVSGQLAHTVILNIIHHCQNPLESTYICQCFFR
jgi:hypothetical protein